MAKKKLNKKNLNKASGGTINGSSTDPYYVEDPNITVKKSEVEVDDIVYVPPTVDRLRRFKLNKNK